MSRIIAGTAGGSTLFSVPGDGTRPTTDRVKEALFSRLESYEVLQGARVLDLFAGSGALGVESASRGAEAVDLVELADKAAATCRRNAELVNKLLGSNRVNVHRAKAETFLLRVPEEVRWDLVFIDPPYALTEAELETVLAPLAKHLSEGAVVVLERSTRSDEPVWPAGLERFSERKYGETTLWFAEPAQQAG
ncbi:MULTISPECIES: 16S rRNA (guanine(966)-N(2))-methyltransferase RsmD [unclassified Arthrobacter]|uniref:16S rRNA (guanine(966)-N(2))-methyltransferase RsmD n=1 Tax=unclassified Arthrobacter TaxID=235627 RepID=UPI001D1457F9|nr:MULTISPECIES: 16S rRNA (guanine(966)-N(2))-methyltransferase RsmD [unclassified Arthrobacter]MCC3275107.1 16S rRNA (guanine(966)-N(2))-methyltransferase RsmD [Arthrobacter sp. zg-Y20]MCC9177296.1 16S rRNA (guanine(966)-N(2))-methyltransferase RsmD [Arthrobacter sp. zg-Y750]MDK1315264.1 16S rRNA (guanine(966)-N(2))-methyltransferase RsmD [Arthrobacter sp. zg.Y20]MDK1329040.1 16S rRNA (guanine(966)-N(2))-methyltransferase RsmD [Arthrobacter sp. zg-Y1143]WIB05096.1 16S rRNA (guanine(966)-N(2))